MEQQQGTLTQATKTVRNSEYYVGLFRDDVERKKKDLAEAMGRLKIAEKEFADGELVTGIGLSSD